LSPRQYEVWCLLQHSNKQIARILGISEGSVKVHLGSLFRKSRMSRRELIAERGPSTPVFPYLSPPPNKVVLAT
jgi:DNA-binding CsgD family transcriptional regulator